MSTSSPSSELTELPEQPTDSIIQVQETSDGLTLTIPWRAGRGRVILLSIIISIWLGLLSLGVMSRINEGDVVPAEWAVWSLFALVGIAIWLAASYHCLQKTIFILSQQTLSIRRLTWFGSEQHHWHCRQLADVYVQHCVVVRDGDRADLWELQIHPLLGEGDTFGLVCSCRPDDLRWLATVLRHRLRCPANDPCSPPPGYIVVSSETSGTDADLSAPSRNVVPFQERREQPAGSKVLVEKSPEGVRLTIPPGNLWLGHIPTMLRAFATVFVLFALVTVILFWARSHIAENIHLVLWDALTFGAGFADTLLILAYLSLVFASTRLGRQSATIVVQDATLNVLYTSPIRGREHRCSWSSQQQPDVRLGHPWGGFDGLWELQIHSGQEKVSLLLGREPIELQWLATLIRQALRQN
jgi:hypothetical protein